MKLKQLISVTHTAFNNLAGNNPLRMAAATAFFTTFALPPILIILLQTFGLFYNKPSVKVQVFDALVSVLGRESSANVYDILEQFQRLAYNHIAAVAGFIFLLFVATTLFNVVRKSVNEIWCIKVKSHTGFMYHLKLRIKSLIVIFFAGLVLLIQLAASALEALLKSYIDEIWNGHNSLLYKIISQLIFIIIATGWFTILFRYLANAHPDWKIAFTGGIFTGVLFTIGKIILGLLLTFNNISTIFGASGSFVLILLFVFYSSFIFYYGAAFTKAFANAQHKKMRLEKYTYTYAVNEVRSE
jgi:membrane protein